MIFYECFYTRNYKKQINSKEKASFPTDYSRIFLMVGHGGVEPPYGAYKAPALTDELMAQIRTRNNIAQSK